MQTFPNWKAGGPMDLLDQIIDLSLSHKWAHRNPSSRNRKVQHGFDGPDRASARRPKSLYLTTNKLRQMSPGRIS